jgi:hypothetical protein
MGVVENVGRVSALGKFHAKAIDLNALSPSRVSVDEEVGIHRVEDPLTASAVSNQAGVSQDGEMVRDTWLCKS